MVHTQYLVWDFDTATIGSSLTGSAENAFAGKWGITEGVFRVSLRRTAGVRARSGSAETRLGP